MLALAGHHAREWNYGNVLNKIARLKLENEVRLMGHIGEDQLRSLYHAADLFVFPSLYEGFGLPVLEAMASGVPVVAGDNSALPELMGGRESLLPDKEKDAWVKRIRELLASERAKLESAKRGIERARDFSWEKTARKTLEAYRQFYGCGATH